jgi:chromosome segregation ATPase
MAKTKRTRAGKGFAEVQKNNPAMTLSATSQQGLAEMARQLEISPSELVEHLVNGKIAVVTENSEKTIAIHPAQSKNQSSTVEIVSRAPSSAADQEQIRTLEEEITQLKKELAQQETLKQNYQAISLKSEQQGIYISELEEARSRQRQEIQNLNHRLSQLQSQVDSQTAEPHAELAAKDQQIAELQAEVQRLQSFASIGEKQVNRWRSRSIQ